MWQKLPVWFRSVVMGLVVSGVPTLIWALLATINMRFTPRVPWAAAVMVAALFAYWRVVRGERLRAAALPPNMWRLALIAGGTAVAAVWAAFGAFRGLLHIVPAPVDLSRFPLITIAASIVMGSAVAGIAEEAGFRGYMQLPLERAYGPVAAIATSSIIFTAVHLTHGARILPFLPFYLAVAVVYGLLPFLTGSIFPSMILHFSGDVMMFAFQVTARKLGALPVYTGRVAVVPAIVAIVLAASSVMSFRAIAARR